MMNDLETTIRSRDVIGLAEGLVMARHRLTTDMAFEVLDRLSHHRQQKLVELATTTAQTGQLPRSKR